MDVRREGWGGGGIFPLVLLCSAGDQEEGVWGRERLNVAQTNARESVVSRR